VAVPVARNARGAGKVPSPARTPALPAAIEATPATATVAAPPPSDSAGDVVQTLTGPGRPGLHRIVWDLRSKDPRPRELGGPTTPDELRQVLGGRYTVSIKVGSKTLTRDIVVEDGWWSKSGGAVR